MGKEVYELYKIRTLTNMHVGSGDIHMGVIDNLVQRDPVFNLPTVFSQSLKGALREFFETVIGNKDLVKYIFGPSPKDSDNAKQSGSGAYKFFSAKLLSIPVPSNKMPFFSGTSPLLLGDLLKDIKEFGISFKGNDELNTFQKYIDSKSQAGSPIIIGNDYPEDIILEAFTPNQVKWADTMVTDSIIQSIIGDDIAVLHCDDFKEYCDYLPVLARNHLENGESQNLWHEEIVPRETRFFFIVARPEEGKDDVVDKYYNIFLSAFRDNLVQIGGNATTGCGYSRIEKVI
jgi:CRISPR-associated protein Cmr4